MGQRICVIADCGRKYYGRGWCRHHYDAWYRSGKLGTAPVTQAEKPLEVRFWEKVDATGVCWEWVGARNADKRTGGYGVAWDGTRTVGAHRLAWRLLVGDLPRDQELDHLCRNRACVNPDHLEPVTHAENVRRGASGWNTRAKTHCPRGHPYEGDNLIVYQGRRFCAACRRLRRN